ncbi:retrovirus-related pol polyprotein from transposon TNT 1-94, partial [Tanacetum coccineum]
MAAVNNVPHLVDKKGGMEPYYIKCIKDGPFQPKTAEGDDKPESQWTPDERRVVIQDQRLKSIIMSCLPDDIMELAKPTESLSQTYTRYKTLLNELANDGGLRNANHTQTLDLADINGSTTISTAFFSNNVIQNFQENSDDEVNERSSEEYLKDLDIEFYKRALLENSKCHFAKDCFSKTSKPSYKSPVTGYSSVSKGFQPKFTLKLIQSSQNSISQADPKAQKDYKAEYKRLKAKITLLEANPSSSQNPKTFQPKNKGLVAETFDWDEEEVSDDEDVTQVKDHRTSDHEMYTASLKRSENYKAQPYQYAYSSKQTLKAKAKPVPPCTYCGFNDHRPGHCRNYPECGICGSYDHFTSGHNRVIHIRGGMLAESSQSSESSIGVKCNTCGSTRHIKEPIWYLDNGCSRSMTGVKSYLHKYVEQPCPKVVIGDNSSCITEGYGSINCGGIIFTKVAFVNGLKYNLISISQLCDAKYIVQFDDKQGTIFNANKEIILIAPRRNDVYVLDMSSLTPNGACFFAKASKSINCKSNVHNHEKYTLVIVDEYSRYTWVHFLRKKSQAPKMIMFFIRMVENQNDVKVKQIRTDNRTKFRNHELESFCDERGISQNFSYPYTPKQNGVAERKNRTLIEAARTMLNGSVLYKHFWTKAVRIACYTQNKSIIVKRHDKTPHEIFRERIPDISYFHMFGCLVFIHDHKDRLGKFDAKADDGYFLGYSFVSKAFRVFNTRRQQIEETYHVTFDESIEAIRFTNTSVDEIGINDSSRYPPDEFLQKDDPSRQYQVDSDVSYYIIPLGRSLTELTQENHVPEVIVPNKPGIPLIENNEVSINESSIPNVPQSHLSNQASTSSHLAPRDRWSKYQHIKLVNIIRDLGEGMLTRSMAAKLTAASASECLFADFLSEIEPKKVSEALKHPGWIDAMQEVLNQFYRNKVWTLVPLPYGKIAIGSKWV